VGWIFVVVALQHRHQPTLTSNPSISMLGVSFAAAPFNHDLDMVVFDVGAGQWLV
jgi:hypothetical protein